MYILFENVEMFTVEYIFPDIFREWLTENGWLSKSSTDEDYWQVWFKDENALHWVTVENFPGTNGDGLPERMRTLNQGHNLETLQEFHHKPARQIWLEMFKLQQQKINDIQGEGDET
jgi:hypothetical protein